MKSLLIASALLATHCIFSYSADEESAPEKPVESKAYVIYLGDGEEAAYVLEGVEASDFKGLKCLKGRHVDVDLAWAKGSVCYIPVERIDSIMEFDSLDAYKDNVREFRENRLKAGAGVVGSRCR